MASPALIVPSPSPTWDPTTSWRAYLVEQHQWAEARAADMQRLAASVQVDLAELDARAAAL